MIALRAVVKVDYLSTFTTVYFYLEKIYDFCCIL